MPNVAELLERESQAVDLEPGNFERLLRRRDRKERNRRISAAVVAIMIALVSLVALTRAFRSTERPAHEPTPPPRPHGIFSEVGGWMAYGNRWGIWAMDPSHAGDGVSRVRLSAIGGTPLEWSSDGSELLISRVVWELVSLRQLRHGEEMPPASRLGLFVLHADGTETHLVREGVEGASFSPDGTTVVFALLEGAQHLEPGLYLIDADGGTPRRLPVEPRRIYFPEQDRSFSTGLYFPAFSPDGTKIAFFDGFGDSTHSLRVVNVDGSDLHVLIDNIDGYRITDLVWSPDGKTLAFGRRINDGVYTIGVDGSGFTLVIPYGQDPHWSLDGSRIWFEVEGVTVRPRDLLRR